MKQRNTSALIGAALLMATSAIGPGFLTQTTIFTKSLGASFGFVILVSILIDIGVQLNIWRVIAVSEMRAQDIANKLLPGLGGFISLLIILGGLAFNIGNVAGAGLGLEALFGVNIMTGACISALIAIAVFINKQIGKAMDRFFYAAYGSNYDIGFYLHHTDIFATIGRGGTAYGGSCKN
nr:hypothetical protein [uncultured Sphingobacterium sp.]